MKIQNYYKKIDKQAHAVFEATLESPELLAEVHAYASDVDQLAQHLIDEDEKRMLRTVCAQLEMSCLCATYGLYHPAMAGLRLCLELGLGSIYFSSNKLAHREWLANGDLSWSVINSRDDGVLSTRFVHAFFPELADGASAMRERAAKCYGCLSEYVHGNSDTWSNKGLALAENPDRRLAYSNQCAEAVVVLKFAYAARHLKFLSENDRDSLQNVFTELLHISGLRECLGGPKEIT